jgi:regulator of sigma E protease
LIEEFGFGYPPRIFSVKVKGTIYSINLIPLGGYVKIYGEDGEPEEKTVQEDKNRIFANKPAWIKILVLSAGVLGNFLFAWFLLTIGFLNGLPSNNAGIFEDKIQNKKIIIQEVTSSSSAERSGIKIGDEI